MPVWICKPSYNGIITMAINEKIIINSGDKDSVSKAFEVAGISKLSVFVFSKSGGHSNHRLGIEVSPDGEHWFDTFISITGNGLLPVDLPPALSARIKVFSVEKTESQVYVHVMS